jgi:cellulose synthase (UDP-forming)
MTTDLNFKGNSQSRLSKKTLWFRYLAEINLILGAWYLYWRIFHSLDLQALWLAVPLLLAEIYSYVGGAMFTIGLWRPLERKIKSLPDLNPPLPESEWPSVDILIACYNEPTEIVETTARAALSIDYPVGKMRVYILDDGNSPDMRALAQQLCLEDLQSPSLQAEVQRLKSVRLSWQQKLQQVRKLIVETRDANLLVAAGTEPDCGDLPDRSWQILEQFMTLTHADDRSITEHLLDREQELTAKIKAIDLELTQLARCRYIARPKPDGRPHYAKAGNINYAIFSGDTTGEFILTLDADHIPKPQFLKRVLPYFYSYNPYTGKYETNRISLVQTPQDFYNIPPDDPYGHRANLFYGPIQQGKDGLNSAFYTGTNAVLRREALVSMGLRYFSAAVSRDRELLNDFALIGGMSSTSITEDMNTAMRLHGTGWKTIYHHELLAEGLAPDDLASTLQQRLRWAQGTIQVLVQENPWQKPGLSFWQRLQYFQTMYSYFSGFATIVLIACPLVFFFTGITPIHTYGADFIIHFVPAFIINRLTFLVVTWGIPAREVWRAEQYAIALFPLFIQAVISVLTKRSIKFKVTPKERQSGIYLNLVMPQLIVCGLTILGLIICPIRLTMSNNLSDLSLYVINAGWAIYNLLLISVIIRAAVWQPKES